MKYLYTIILFIILLPSYGISGTRDPGTPDNKYIEYGEKFPYIGKLIIIDTEDQIMNASAVAFSERVLITAAHVLKNKKDCFIDINNKKIIVIKTITHEDYKEENFGYCDIAVCLCEEPIGLNWYPPLYENQDEVNQICSMGGYGLTGTFNGGFSNIGDSKRRAGSNKVDSIDRDLLICTPSKENRTALEFCISPGDSGGGLFIGNKLAGINSCIMAVNRASKSDYGSESGHTRISKYIPWIRENSEKLK